MYEIRRARERKGKNKFIILTQMKNFIEDNTFIQPALTLGSMKFTWNRWQEYFYKEVLRWAIPCHYFIEQVGNDYSIFIGEPKYSPSYFITDLIKADLIHPQYKESIVIGIGEDLGFEKVDRRLYEQLAFRLVSPLLLEHKANSEMDEAGIKYLDEIIDFSVYNKLYMDRKVKYRIEPSKYFFRYDLIKEVRRHSTNIKRA